MVNCVIPTPTGKVSNLTFGGEKFDVLYVTAGDKVFKRKVKVTGANGWDKPVKPPEKDKAPEKDKPTDKKPN